MTIAMSSMKTVKIIDWQTKEQQKLPRVGQGSYMRLLIQQGYDIVSTQMLGWPANDEYLNPYNANPTSSPENSANKT